METAITIVAWFVLAISAILTGVAIRRAWKRHRQ
jgi:hypothetical protein